MATGRKMKLKEKALMRGGHTSLLASQSRDCGLGIEGQGDWVLQ